MQCGPVVDDTVPASVGRCGMYDWSVGGVRRTTSRFGCGVRSVAQYGDTRYVPVGMNVALL